jgi:pimeloyl-ACP methyl ester carboxylesterase
VLPPETARPDVPTVVAWHFQDPPRTERAMAAALPLAGLDAWRVHLGLPLSGSRSPQGRLERLGYEDAVLKVYGPVVFGAAEEFPAALAALRAEHGLGAGRIGVLGGSVGALVAQQVDATTPVDAVALVSPVTRLRPLVVANGRRYGFDYPWRPESEEVAVRLDWWPGPARSPRRRCSSSGRRIRRTGSSSRRRPCTPPCRARYWRPCPGWGTPSPTNPAPIPLRRPRTPAAVDRIVASWFRRWLWL